MFIFIFEYINQVSSAYHSGGGLVVMAKDKERAKELIQAAEDVTVTEEDWKDVKSYPISEHVDEEVITFPDAGCR